MNRKFLRIFLLSSVVIGAAAAVFFTSAKYNIQKNVRVTCMYMAYACGDCYPQYNVENVLPSSLEKKLLNNDIDIEFASKEQEQLFKKKVGRCRICYKFDFKGDLFYSEKKNCYVIKLGNYKMQLKDNKCCDY